MKMIKFPDKEYILRCHKCKINAFYVILNSENWQDIKGFECTECGKYTEIQPNKQNPADEFILDGTTTCPECGFTEKHLASCKYRR